MPRAGLTKTPTPLHTCSHRDMQIIWGAIFQLFVFFPDFRHFRVINIMALVGTTTTAVFLLYAASAQVGRGISGYLKLIT